MLKIRILILLTLIAFSACAKNELNESETVTEEPVLIETVDETYYENYIYPFHEDLESLLDKDPEYIHEIAQKNITEFSPIELIKNDPEKFKENFGNFISDKEINEILTLMNILSLNKSASERYNFKANPGAVPNDQTSILRINLENLTDIDFNPADKDEKIYTYEKGEVSEFDYSRLEISSLILVRNDENIIEYIITDISGEEASPGGTFIFSADVIMTYNENGQMLGLLILPNKDLEIRDTILLSYTEFYEEVSKIWESILEVNQLAIPRILYGYEEY